jgi:hypothetical protein
MNQQEKETLPINEEEAWAKNVEINEIGILHCLAMRRKIFVPKIMSINVVIRLV